jgi:hypothetical protein
VLYKVKTGLYNAVFVECGKSYVANS